MAILQEPLSIDIVNIEIDKYVSGQRVSLMAQFVELNIYTSIFSPSMSADLVINDTVGFIHNYPIVGEETVTFSFKHTRDRLTGSFSGDDLRAFNSVTKVKFRINSVEHITPKDTNKSMLYVLRLVTPEMMESTEINIMKAYNQATDETIKNILQHELLVESTKIKDVLFEKAKSTGVVIIPNMKPFEAIQWLTKRAVPVDPKNYMYMFFETFDGYNFVTTQELIKRGKQRTIPKYYYMSNIELLKKETLTLNNIKRHNVISGLNFGSRFNTNEKILAGYFENEFYDVDILNKKVWSTPGKLAAVSDESINRYNMNTPKFITDHQTNNNVAGSKTRVRYVISQNQGDVGDDRFWRDKFGNAIKLQTAMSQVSLQIAAPGDTRMNVGDMLEISLPEIQGISPMKEEKYVSGNYLITSMKQSISAGSNHSMAMTLHKDSFGAEIEQQMRYKNGR